MPVLSRVTIASRESALALWQAHYVRARLQAAHPRIQVGILGVTTQADRLSDTSLASFGGKGLFVKELELALARGEADLAVHSMKDVPAELPAEFTVAAITAREDPRDAFVSVRFASLPELPAGSVVGTSSLRREAQIRAHVPEVEVRPLRGNVNTRLRKLDEGHYDAIVLAVAGLKRLGLGDRIRTVLDVQDCVPAPGQGALGLECLAVRTDIVAMLQPLTDEPTAWCVRAERAVSRALAGSCVVPLGAHAWLDNGVVRMRAFVAQPDGSRLVTGALDDGTLLGDPEAYGERVAMQLAAGGAREILERLAT
jgi:hydroxymethylbilane synthase